MFEFADPKSYYLCEKFLDMLYRTEISAIMAYFCPNLAAMATALAPLKIQITVRTVVQNCCKGDSPCQWKTLIFTSSEIKNP